MPSLTPRLEVKKTGFSDVWLSHTKALFLDFTKEEADPKLKTRHHLIKITLPLVDELQRERGIVVPGRIEGNLQYQITGSRLNQSQRNTTDRQTRGTKTGVESRLQYPQE